MRAPKQLFWVEILPGGPGLRLHQRGGGKFSTLRAAQEKATRLAREGIKTQIYETQEIKWVPAEEDAKTDEGDITQWADEVLGITFTPEQADWARGFLRSKKGVFE